MRGLRKSLLSRVKNITDNREIDANHVDDLKLPCAAPPLYVIPIQDSYCLTVSDRCLDGVWPFAAH